jgi:type I restriction enzyme M protein
MNIPNFQNLIVPVLTRGCQQRILDYVKKAFNQRSRSKQLLEIAKTGVERAIETDEATATTWINQQLEALEVELS